MEKKKRILLLAACIALGMLAGAAIVLVRLREKPQAVSEWPDPPPFPYDRMLEGDLVFRTGTGLYSQMLNVSTDTVHYSHVGLLVHPDSLWEVVHAVPKEPDGPDDFERVKRETLDRFLSKELALHAEFVHTGLLRPTRIVAEALQYARDSVRFDNRFDLEDSTELYCTELIWRLFRREGIDLSEGRRSMRNLTCFKGGLLTPEDLFRYSGNQSYFQY